MESLNASDNAVNLLDDTLPDEFMTGRVRANSKNKYLPSTKKEQALDSSQLLSRGSSFTERPEDTVRADSANSTEKPVSYLINED